jgi:cell division protein FtsB
MQKIITFVITIFIVALIVFGLGKQIASAIQSGKRLDSEADAVNKLQTQNRELKEKLTQTERYDFIEKTARDKLNLSKNGETIVVVPSEAVDKIISENTPLPVEVKLSNWQGWLKLFVHS